MCTIKQLIIILRMSYFNIVGAICPQLNEFILSQHVSVSCTKEKYIENVHIGLVHPFHLSSNGIPNHHYNSSAVVAHGFDISIPIKMGKEKATHMNRSDLYKKSTLGDGPIGFALNGIPFYSALHEENKDAVQGQYALAHDDCMGYSTEAGHYFYRTAPPCLFSKSEGKGQGRGDAGSNIGDIPSVKYDSFTFQNAFGLYWKDSELYWSTKVTGAPFVTGYAIDGFPIYSPFDADGNEHKDLDICNGKFSNGRYAYYSTLHFPYTLGCYGPVNTTNTMELTHSKQDHRYIRCPPGRHSDNANNSICKPCRAGRFGMYGTVCTGNKCVGDINEDCSGPCSAGYFCPSSSHSPMQEECGSANVYCPEGTQYRIKVEEGFYSIPLLNPNDLGIDLNQHKQENERQRSGQSICDPGFWCKNGIRFPCSEGGTYGDTSGLMNNACTAPCPKGHYCLPFTPRPIKCPSGTFGQTIGLKDSSCSGLCEPGYFCEEGSVNSKSKPCPEGRAGMEYGLKDEQCSLECDIIGANCIIHYCDEGHFCPSNSTSQKQFECGGPHLYCPAGSSYPTKVQKGYYTIGSLSLIGVDQSNGDKTIRIAEVICEKGHYCIDGVKYVCPAGKFCNETGLTSKECSGDCEAGYHCPEGSTQPNQIMCGSSKYYCPKASPSPILVDEGYFTQNGISQAICQPGSYCIDGIAYLCPPGRFGSSIGLANSSCDGPSDPGYYTPAGSTSSTQIPCPAGTFGLTGMKDEKCMGLAAPGYYTPIASSSPWQKECGGEMVYCPEGSAVPLEVAVGFFSTGGTATTRTGQQKCDSFHHNASLEQDIYHVCPSTTRTNETVVVLTKPLQQVDVDYHIDPEDQFRYDYTYPENI